ncbi:hypothetical protein [Labrys neptuniae]
MPLGYAVASATAALTILVSSTAINLDQPTDDEATAAYRAIPAVSAAGGKQQQTMLVDTCAPAKGRPGVECQVQLRLTPQGRGQMIQTYFARGPDSAWVAEVMR